MISSTWAISNRKTEMKGTNDKTVQRWTCTSFTTWRRLRTLLPTWISDLPMNNRIDAATWCKTRGTLKRFIFVFAAAMATLSWCVDRPANVDNKQSLPRNDLLACCRLKEVKHCLGVDVRVVDPFPQQVVSLQVDLDVCVWIELVGKRVHKPGFSNLPCPHEDEWFALAAQVPVDHFLKDVS